MRYSLIAVVLTFCATVFANETPAPTPKSSHTFVIVHGAWAGGWEHKKLAQALEARGHKVLRPTLTGQGERVHLASPEVDLRLHIHDIANFIRWEELKDVVLVGHSYGGMVITGVVDQMPERMKHVIYIDAIVPEDGQTAFEAIGPNRPRPQAVDGYFVLPNQQNKSVPHVVPQPAKTVTQPISLTNQEAARKVPTTYLLTVDKGKEPSEDSFFRCYERAQERGWKTEVMIGDHIVHLTQTDRLADLLVAAVP